MTAFRHHAVGCPSHRFLPPNWIHAALPCASPLPAPPLCTPTPAPFLPSLPPPLPSRHCTRGVPWPAPGQRSSWTRPTTAESRHWTLRQKQHQQQQGQGEGQEHRGESARPSPRRQTHSGWCSTAQPLGTGQRRPSLLGLHPLAQVLRIFLLPFFCFPLVSREALCVGHLVSAHSWSDPSGASLCPL